MRQLKILGMDANGLRIFYCANVWSILSYTSPAWYYFLSDYNKQRVEHIQKRATKLIFPDISYDQRLNLLELPTVNSYIFNYSCKMFNKIVNDPTQPLFKRISFNVNRASSRNLTRFRP